MNVRGRLVARRDLRRRERQRRRGGPGRGPVALQHTARAVVRAGVTCRSGLRHLSRGDRPLVAVLLAAVGLAVVLVSGPAQQYLDVSARVEALSTTSEALETANAGLEQRREDLHDPATIEQLAREQQGLARPGEVPYTLVPPQVERPVIVAPPDAADLPARPWYRRLWEAFTGRAP